MLVPAGQAIPPARAPAVAALRSWESSFGPLAARLAVSLALLVLLVVATRPLTLRLPRPGRSWSLLLLSVGLGAAALWAVRLLTPIPLGAAPLALAGMLPALTISRRAGLGAAAATLALAGVSGGVGVGGTLATLAAGALVATALTAGRRSLSAGLAGLVGAAAQLGLVLLAGTSADGASPGVEAPASLLAGLGPAAAGLGCWLLGPLALRAAGRASAWRLRRLTRPSHPLLVALRQRAPGTFRHSVRVAQLAEAGARAISADAEWVRLGGLYHDLGKLIGPEFFHENHLSGGTDSERGSPERDAPRAVRPDPISSLAPEAAARRIRRHVSDGLRLAARYRLPHEIRVVIAEHHGSSPVRSLLPPGAGSAAGRAEAEAPTRSSHLRYPGPLPGRPETALVQLADAAEAATRGLHRPGLGALGLALEEAIEALHRDGQLADSGLGDGDLDAVQQALLAALRHLHR